MVRQLLQKKAKIDEADKTGLTPLMAAAQEGFTGIVQLLLDNNANVNTKTQTGATALMKASFRRGNADVVELLLDREADVNAKAQEGGTAWILANVSGDKKILDLLTKAGGGGKKTEKP